MVWWVARPRSAATAWNCTLVDVSVDLGVSDTDVRIEIPLTFTVDLR